jgi:hypothetical protein
MQGSDLGPLYLAQNPPAWRDEFFYEHPTITSKDRIPTSQAVIRKDWKYIEWPEFDHQQLFDLESDPAEIRNLAGQPAHASQQRRCASSSTRGASGLAEEVTACGNCDIPLRRVSMVTSPGRTGSSTGSSSIPRSISRPCMPGSADW